MKTRAIPCFAMLIIGIIVSLVFPPQNAYAAKTWVVTSLGDNSGFSCTAGDCTLRAAINAASSGDIITFAPNVIGMIHLLPGYGGLTIDKNLTIKGPGAYNLTVSGSGGGTDKNISVFTVNQGASLNLSGLSIVFGWNLSGGAIKVQPGGTLTVDRCSFFDNYAREDGAVLYNHGTVTITRSYFGDNHAGTAEDGFGGAICNNEDGLMSITNSTFTLNTATQGGTIDNMGSLTIVNSTIKGNSAFSAGGVLNEFGGTVTFKNVLLADNENGNCSGIVVGASTHNLSTDGTCSAGFTQVSLDALKLKPQTGLPAYFPLDYGSVAIDAGTNDGCPSVDQAGNPRPLDGDDDGMRICDVGAFEIWPPDVSFIFIPLVAR
jgi:CSLREA domain-containing protein